MSHADTHIKGPDKFLCPKLYLVLTEPPLCGQVYPVDFKNAQAKLTKPTGTADEHLTPAEKEVVGLNPEPEAKVKVRKEQI